VTKVFLFLAAIAAPFVLALAMTKGLNHDEHQHVAAGVLLVREGLWPYLDFPHFHTPYLVGIYAFIFKFTDHFLLGARLFSAACAVGIVAIVGTAAYRLLGRGGAIGALLLALTAAVFTHTTGRAWNQEPALLCALVAFLVHATAVARASKGWMLASGALLGLAIGLRVTYAPLVAPFAFALFLVPEARARWVGLLLFFAAGLALSLAPLGALFVAAPEQTFFGTFQFSGVNIEYRTASGEPRTMTLLKKLRFFWKEFIRPDAGLVLAFVIALGAMFAALRPLRQRMPFTLRFLLLALPFLLLGSIAPSPLYDQYFYPFVPFLILGAAIAMAAIPEASPWRRRAAFGSVAAVALSVLLAFVGTNDYRKLARLIDPYQWTPVEMHAESRELRRTVPSGTVLTLSPVRVLEAGLRIEPALCTGPFAWRMAPYVEPAKALRLGLPTREWLALRPNPSGYLLGYELADEKPVAEDARRRGYRPIERDFHDVVWIPQR
jgi:4-amino-4-deoxy-L-arabinose transferase-like glycosyltransferase